MVDGTTYPKAKKVQLYEKRGETSRFIDAEITENGNLVIFGQDIGKLPREFWDDEDYEFWVHVPAKYKDDVLRALLGKFRAGNPKAVDEYKDFKHKDDVLLALLEKLYAGNPKAVDQFKDFMRAQGIPVEFDSWA